MGKGRKAQIRRSNVDALDSLLKKIRPMSVHVLSLQSKSVESRDPLIRESAQDRIRMFGPKLRKLEVRLGKVVKVVEVQAGEVERRVHKLEVELIEMDMRDRKSIRMINGKREELEQSMNKLELLREKIRECACYI